MHSPALQTRPSECCDVMPSGPTPIVSSTVESFRIPQLRPLASTTEATSKDGTPFTTLHPIMSSLGAGAIAGAVAKTVIAPLDRTKINFQIRNEPYSLRKAFKFLGESYHRDGLSSWWRGNSATMARVIPYAALQYSCHEQYKKLLKVETNEQRAQKHGTCFIAGSLAGSTAASLTYPLDLARARMAVSRCETYKNLSEVFLKIWKNEGPHALYRGFVPSLLGVIPYAGTSFFTYEFLKRHRSTQLNLSNERDLGRLHPMERLAFGAIAGLLGQSTSYPLDIVRRRMQTSRLTGQKYRTIRGTLLHIRKHEGLRRGLYKGLSMNWIKGPIATGTSFTVYDIIRNFLDHHL